MKSWPRTSAIVRKMREYKDDEKKKKVVAFKAATSSKSKGKASMQEIEEEDDEGLEEIDQELALLVRRFIKIMKNKRSAQVNTR